MKKTDSTKIFHIIKNKLTEKNCERHMADTLAEEIYCQMHNNKRFIIGYGRLYVNNNTPAYPRYNKPLKKFTVAFNCEFLFPDTGDKVTARFFYKAEFKNSRLFTKSQFRNIDYPIGSTVCRLG